MAEEKRTFEERLEELEKVVGELETGELTLERAVSLFERGVSLSDLCRKELREAEARVEILIEKNEEIAAEPFEPEDTGTE